MLSPDPLRISHRTLRTGIRQNVKNTLGKLVDEEEARMKGGKEWKKRHQGIRRVILNTSYRVSSAPEGIYSFGRDWEEKEIQNKEGHL